MKPSFQTVPSLFSHFITFYFISLTSLVILWLCRCVSVEHRLLSFLFKWQRGAEVHGGLSFGIRLRLQRLSVYTSNWNEPDQLNPQTVFYWVGCEGDWVYHFFSLPEKKTTCSCSCHKGSLTTQVSLPLRAATRVLSPLLVSPSASPQKLLFLNS